jgi:hypothetical protein
VTCAGSSADLAGSTAEQDSICAGSSDGSAGSSVALGSSGVCAGSSAAHGSSGGNARSSSGEHGSSAGQDSICAGSSDGGVRVGQVDEATARLHLLQGQVQAALDAITNSTNPQQSLETCLAYNEKGFKSIVEQLQKLASALCAKLPVAWICNNPNCLSLTGVSELQLVGGKVCVCGGCKVAR